MYFRDEPLQKVGLGSKFERNGEYYLLACIAQCRVVLIDINGGNRWSEPVTVGRVDWLSRAEWEAVSAGSGQSPFVLLPNDFLRPGKIG